MGLGRRGDDLEIGWGRRPQSVGDAGEGEGVGPEQTGLELELSGTRGARSRFEGKGGEAWDVSFCTGDGRSFIGRKEGGERRQFIFW